MINTITALTVAALDQFINEVLNVATGLPYAGMRDGRALNTHDVVMGLHHRPPPVATNIIAHFNAEWPEVIDARNTAINFGIGVNEAASLTQRHDLLDS